MMGQFFRLAGRAERVFHAHELDGAGRGRGQGFGHRAAQPAMDIVIFRRHQCAGLDRAARQ